MSEIYRQYFDIDPEYFPAVNAEVIKYNPELWKKYYPHETFVKLVKDIVTVLTRKQKLNVWVEGAYGTGKSHSVLTLKHLLDATVEETKEYFEAYKLDNDLLNKFQGLKNSGRILTIHRYGSSSIHGDNDLFLAIQESIEQALLKAGIENKAKYSLKSSVLHYLEDSENKKIFDVFVNGAYRDLFGGESTDTIIEHLKTYSDQPLQILMDKIFRVASERQITAFKLTDRGLCEWIRDVISKNNLKAIVFIWDEFDEYFSNNSRRLTGFQTIAELSETDPFYLVLVTHQSQALLDDSDSDKSKILGRFLKPTCQIELPENMAFKLMGAAMQKKEDPDIIEDWQSIVDDLNDRTTISRKTVKEKAQINDQELSGILPIHPYAALLLKYISVTFDSNQRSMFDFIKNDRGDEIEGFQWFIDNCGPYDENPLLTIDMLWGFFYERGKQHLAPGVKSILDNYSRLATRGLENTEKRVLKTILLFQAMSLNVGDAVDLFIPNEKNLELAFEGTDIDNGAARSCAEKLVRDKVIFKKELGGGKTQYSILTNEFDSSRIDKLKEQFKDRNTTSLISDGELLTGISFPQSIKLRFLFDAVGATDFDTRIKHISSISEDKPQNICCLIAFARNNSESIAIGKKINKWYSDNPSTNVVVIDASASLLGEKEFDEWIKNKATAVYFAGKDNDQSKTYEGYANAVLAKWRQVIGAGEFAVFDRQVIQGEIVHGNDALVECLKGINRKRFNLCLEEIPAIDNMFLANALKTGVECGATQVLKGTFLNAKKLDQALNGAWKVENYWIERPNLLVSRIKVSVEKTIKDAFESKGRISIAEIYESLKEAPYGFLPCNLTAFILGFVLKEYATGSYTWSDNLTSDTLSLEKLKDMVDEVIKLDITPSPRYRDKYIVTMSEEERAFMDTTAELFGIPRSICTSIETTREQIRKSMKGFSFPIWTLKYIVADEHLKTPSTVLDELIDSYCGIANLNNIDASKTETEYALSIGRIFLNNGQAQLDLKHLLTKDKCSSGMKVYLQNYREGILPALANSIDDGGQFLNVLRAKFDADAANWVWNIETANKKIDEVITEYQIVLESNKLLNKSNSLLATINEWRDKCDRIHIPYDSIKNDVADARTLFELLCGIMRTGNLAEPYRKDFLNALIQSSNRFSEFFSNQIALFKKVCAFYLTDLSDEEISEVYKKLPSGCFIKDKGEYMSLVGDRVEEYKKNLGHSKLKSLWFERTQTNSPYEWSNKYLMPILAMIPDSEVPIAREVFGTINKPHPDSSSIEKALAYLEKATFYEDLKDKSKRDKAFSDVVLKTYSVIISDIESAKLYLSRVIAAEPYEWYGLIEVEKKLRQMAEAKYVEEGCARALDKIDNMDVADVKRYLKELIKDNMTVGIEIIKSH